MGRSMNFLSLIITFLLFLMPSTSYSQNLGNNIVLTHRKILPTTPKPLTSYAVIFDAGSTGTRVHVFHFDQNLDLIRIGNDLEFFDKITPGLSAYADNPKEAAKSLIPLLKEAENVVPQDQQHKTPVRLGATAGLRLLKGDASERILEEVKDMLGNRTAFNLQPDAVSIIGGTQEGSYLWVTANYLKGKVGEKFSKTVGIIDLGGGSVQMAYAVSNKSAKKAPKVAKGEEPYIKKLFLKNKQYNLYVHSYLRYGKEASRAEIFKVTNGSANPCVLAGFQGIYTYEGVEYKAYSSSAGSNLEKCRKIVVKALNLKASCAQKNCTFDGIWDGGRGSGQNNLILTSSFYFLATEISIILLNNMVGFADINKPNAIVRPVDFEIAAKKACKIKFEDAKSTYPNHLERELPYTCMDLVYQYTLLVQGFGLDPLQKVTVAKEIVYQDALVDASWPLGSAIEAISSFPKFEKLLYFV